MRIRRMFNPIAKLAMILPISTLIASCDRLSVSNPSNDIYSMAVAQKSRAKSDRKADQRRMPVEILALSGVKPGMVVVDLLGGGGYYSELFNSLVGPGGKVYLQNNSLFLRFSSDQIDVRLANGRLGNVIRIDSEFADLRLPKDVDLIFMGLSYHDIYVPRDDPIIMTSRDEFLPQIWGSLKPGGRLLIIDHAAAPGSGWSAAPKLHRIAEDYVIEDLSAAGFTLIDQLDSLRNQDDNYALDIWNEEVFQQTDRFVLLFEKPIRLR